MCAPPWLGLVSFVEDRSGRSDSVTFRNLEIFLVGPWINPPHFWLLVIYDAESDAAGVDQICVELPAVIFEASLTSSELKVVFELTKPTLVVNKRNVRQRSLKGRKIGDWRVGTIFKTLPLRKPPRFPPMVAVSSPMIARPLPTSLKTLICKCLQSITERCPIGGRGGQHCRDL